MLSHAISLSQHDAGQGGGKRLGQLGEGKDQGKGKETRDMVLRGSRTGRTRPITEGTSQTQRNHRKSESRNLSRIRVNRVVKGERREKKRRKIEKYFYERKIKNRAI